ncbi:fumarate/nitrate reduction transcriptional regulator [compost metagenome]
MISQDNLQIFANIFKDLPIEDLAELFAKASSKKISAGEIYIHLHEENKKLAYIEKGIIRTYAFKENGDEATLLLRWEDQFIGSHDSILLNKPSNFIYQALEETHILEIDYREVEKIMAENPKYEPIRNHVLMSMLSASLKMIEDFILLNPEERYKKLIAEKFDIVNRVPDKYIASMLGITPVSLSRIRKRISSKRR